MSEPLKACPFWSRVAVVNGITLAMCSPKDLEWQRERGFGELEGFEREKHCDRRDFLGNRCFKSCVWAHGISYDKLTVDAFLSVLAGGSTDEVWANVLEWAARQ